jgi:hypothetical protein
MAQEAFLRAYRALGTWRRDAAFSTWLFALATNLYRTELRRIPIRAVPLSDAPEPKDHRATDSGLENDDRDRAVRRAVFALPAKYREALTLFYFHEMDVHDAARSLGALVTFLVMGLSRPDQGTELSNRLTRTLEVAKDAGMGWIAVALVVSLVSVVLSMRVVGRRNL